jgi:transcription initiation factor TFIIIB Brf1 subunit/transcription initiation factor TFIIB
MTANEWIQIFADELGVPPPDETTAEQLLALAAVAAHQSERTAAPIACFLVGQAGVDPVRAGAVAAGVHEAGGPQS